ncbi:amino acid permease [Sphingomonas sp. C3-2]|uniref:amino acid permease n=1 Tax=Sphingomonas sp. C3-2 TaxID=3062169 RepID=UPI00294B0B6A|nr:amino acid permease [Sphingomonas sp. C3-2]WOK35671.1 amino acid permease [Sphingomonas sp. C3-2]
MADGAGGGDVTLARTLSWPHLVALGVGAIVGTGILTLIGVGAAKAGPAVLVSFAIAGFVCACAALAYAEMATRTPAAGGAYAYARDWMGRGPGWFVGWSLVLEYSLVVSAVAVGWSGYAAPLFIEWLGFPPELTVGPHLGGIMNLPAVVVIWVVAGVLMLGTGKGAALNAALVFVKLAALAVFAAVTIGHFDLANLHPFNPYGFSKSMGPDGVERGIMAAAAIIFSAFYGFDAVATAAEETRNPKRDLTLGIIGSMIACALIYTLIAALALGASPFTRFADSPEPLALILRELGEPGAATFLALSAVIALPTVIFAFFFGQSRIFLALARDGFLPAPLAQVSADGRATRVIGFTAMVVSVIAALLPLGEIVALANAGTLLAFGAVASCLLIARRRGHQSEHAIRIPYGRVIALIALAGCFYLFISLPRTTHGLFLAWNVLGVLIYWVVRRRAAAAR